jgi:hypothetical protein
MALRTYDEAEVRAFMCHRHVIPVRVLSLNHFMTESSETAREQRNEDGLGHVELEARHGGVLFKGSENFIRSLFEVGNNQRSVVSEGSKECMSLGVRKDKLAVESTEE